MWAEVRLEEWGWSFLGVAFRVAFQVRPETVAGPPAVVVSYVVLDAL